MIMAKLITKETLRKWDACTDGYKRFCELFPDGADLQTASKGLIDDGHPGWSDWLWWRCKEDSDYAEQTVVTGGDGSTVTGGYDSTAIGGEKSTVTGGDGSTVIGGYKSTVTGGSWSTVTCGRGSKARAGEGGAIVIEYFDGEKYRKLCSHVGEGGLKPDTFYHVVDGKFEEWQEPEVASEAA